MPFTTRIPVRFADADIVGFVYYPRLLHYCHVGMEDFIAARCGVTYARLLEEERLGFPTVNAQAEFSSRSSTATRPRSRSLSRAWGTAH